MLRHRRSIFIFILVFVLVSFSLPVNAAETEEDHLISTIFFHTDIRDALDEIMLQTGVNIIADDTVRGAVTLDLDQIPLERALHMMLLSGGYSFREFDDYYLVSMADPRSRNFQHLAETETFHLQYIGEREARSLIPRFYDDFLRSSGERDVITITATPEIIESFKEDLASIDTPPGEVKIQVHVTEISSELLNERGGDILNFIRDQGRFDKDNEDYIKDNIYKIFYDRYNFMPQFEGVDFGTIEGRLKFLSQSEDVTIEANPSLLVNDRSTANLFIGEEQVIFLERDDGRSRLERVNVGVDVHVTPQIINDDVVKLDIHPDMSHFSEERQDRLVVKRSELQTTVYARSGEPLDLAGMTLGRETEFSSSVPVLGKIPLVRWLFSEEVERESERELIIFLTPEIVRK